MTEAEYVASLPVRIKLVEAMINDEEFADLLHFKYETKEADSNGGC